MMSAAPQRPLHASRTLLSTLGALGSAKPKQVPKRIRRRYLTGYRRRLNEPAAASNRSRIAYHPLPLTEDPRRRAVGICLRRRLHHAAGRKKGK